MLQIGTTKLLKKIVMIASTSLILFIPCGNISLQPSQGNLGNSGATSDEGESVSPSPIKGRRPKRTAAERCRVKNRSYATDGLL